jgi:type I restriction enzyme S subunit
MNNSPTFAVGEALVKRTGSVDPKQYPDEVFDLYSVPAYDRGQPDVVAGSDIGSSKQIVQPGDVLLCRIVPHIRRAWIVGPASGRRLVASGEWMVFRPARIWPAFLRNIFLSDSFHKQMMQTVAGVGGSLMRARPSYVADIQVPLPPRDEQRRIAAILDQAAILRAKRHQVIAQLDDLKQSIFLDTFGSVADWPDRWPMGTIGEMVEDVQYGTSGKAGDTGSWPIVRMGNISDEGRLDLSNLKWIDLKASDVPKFTLQCGDLLFNRTNSKDKVGKTCVVGTDKPLAFAGYLVRVRLKPDHRAEFVNAYMTSGYGRALRQAMAKTAVNQANINATEMQSIPIALPPTRLQQKFSALLSRVGAERDRQFLIVSSWRSPDRTTSSPPFNPAPSEENSDAVRRNRLRNNRFRSRTHRPRCRGRGRANR